MTIEPVRRPAPVPSLDEIAQDPAKTSGLPVDAAEKLLAQAHVAEGALLARLMAARASTDGQLEAQAEEDRWLPPEEAAALLGLTVQQLSRRRNIPRKKIGHRTVRYSLAVLKRGMARA